MHFEATITFFNKFFFTKRANFYVRSWQKQLRKHQHKIADPDEGAHRWLGCECMTLPLQYYAVVRICKPSHQEITCGGEKSGANLNALPLQNQEGIKPSTTSKTVTFLPTCDRKHGACLIFVSSLPPPIS